MKARNNLLQVLSPYGNWAHVKGNQLVDEDAALAMVKNSERLFAREIPIYIGHPDENSQRCKHKRVGKVEKIFRTKHGIIVSALYTDEVYKKIISKEIKAMSPRWEMQKIDNDCFRPIRLVSVGLTNNPNISGSGEIIDVKATSISNASHSRTLDFAKSFQKSCNKLLLKTKSTQSRLGQLTLELRQKSIKRRLEKLNPKKAQKSESFQELSMRAKEISLESGESYTKVFAKLKNKKLKTQK